MDGEHDIALQEIMSPVNVHKKIETERTLEPARSALATMPFPLITVDNAWRGPCRKGPPSPLELGFPKGRNVPGAIALSSPGGAPWRSPKKRKQAAATGLSRPSKTPASDADRRETIAFVCRPATTLRPARSVPRLRLRSGAA